jgi:hypothetical protein
VDEEALLSDLPMDILHDNKPQHRLDHIRWTPLVDEMDTKLCNTRSDLYTHRA